MSRSNRCLPLCASPPSLITACSLEEERTFSGVVTALLVPSTFQTAHSQTPRPAMQADRSRLKGRLPQSRTRHLITLPRLSGVLLPVKTVMSPSQVFSFSPTLPKPTSQLPTARNARCKVRVGYRRRTTSLPYPIAGFSVEASNEVGENETCMSTRWFMVVPHIMSR